MDMDNRAGWAGGRMPRGVYTWGLLRLDNFPAERLVASPRLRRLVEENRPPWVAARS